MADWGPAVTCLSKTACLHGIMHMMQYEQCGIFPRQERLTWTLTVQ